MGSIIRLFRSSVLLKWYIYIVFIRALQMYMCIWCEGEQGFRSDGSTRLPPMWPGFKSRRRRHMWVGFVVGSLPCPERFFTVFSGFSLSSKTNISKFQFDLERTDAFERVQLLSVSWINKFQTTIYNLHGVRPADLFFSIDTPTKLVKDDVVEIRVSFKLP